MKRLFVVGASVLQQPAIARAKELGFYVGVADYNPKAAAIQYADEYFNVSTIDIRGITAAAQCFRADGIITLATDMPVRSVAAACRKLGLPGISPETALKATDKGQMIQAFEQHNVAHPWFYIASDADEFGRLKESLTYPCIFKPTDNAGSRGVVLAASPLEAESAYTYSRNESRNGGVIIEDYMRGNEVSAEVLVVDGTVHVLAVTDKLTTGEPHFVEMGHSQPSLLGEGMLRNIEELAGEAVRALGLDTGPAHIEIMVTAEGPKMIELGARLGGDCITTHLVPLSTGIDMVEAVIRQACGEAADLAPKFRKGSAIRYIETPPGTIETIEGLDEAAATDGIKEIVLGVKPGDTAAEIRNSLDRKGYVIAQGKDSAEAIQSCEEAMRKIRIKMEKR